MVDEKWLRRCEQLDWRSLVRMFAQCLREAPNHLEIPARALRERARAQELPEEAIGLLAVCLRSAEDALVAADLAKALAAFGRKAQEATPVLLEVLRGIVVSDDPEFWAYDGCLHALGYIGDAQALAFLQELEEKAPPVTRAGDLYQGSMPEEDREQLFVETLARVRGLLEGEEEKAWLARRTDWKAEESQTVKMPSWMIR